MFSVDFQWGLCGRGRSAFLQPESPWGGTALFALLAMGGDMGASIGPSVIGIFTQNANDNMKAGMLAGIAFPILLIIAICVIKWFIPTSKRDT